MNSPTLYIKIKAEDRLDLLKLSAILYATDFDGQEEDRTSMTFYYSDQVAFDLAQSRMEKMDDTEGCRWEVGSLEYQNWNAIWEENYAPSQIADVCLIRAPFHPAAPEGTAEIVISPRMSFGTGHHPTTSLCLQEMAKMRLKDSQILDYGTGTGILAIYAMQRGAAGVLGIDIEENAVQNAGENAELNGMELDLQLGNIDLLPRSPSYDIVVANVNKNTIVANAQEIAARQKNGGELLLSGFYMRDIPEILEKMEILGYEKIAVNSEQNWAILRLLKIS